MIISSAAIVTPSPRSLNYEITGGDSVSDYLLGGGDVLTVLSGGSASKITILDGAVEYVSSGGVDVNTAIMAGGKQYVDGGTVNNVYLGLYNDYMFTGYGGYVSTWGGENDIYDTVYRTYLYPPSEQYVMSGGVVNNGLLSASTSSSGVGGGWTTAGYEQSNIITYITKANQYISNGGVVNNITLQGSNISQYIYSGGLAAATTIGEGAYQYVSFGGIVRSTYIDGGQQRLFSGAVASNTFLGSGEASIDNGAITIDARIYGGSMYAASGAVVSNTHIDVGGSLYAHSGAIVSNTHIDGGTLVIYSNIDKSDIVLSKGTVAIGLGGTVTGDFNLVSNTRININSGGHLEGNVIVNSKGSLYIENTALLQGDVTLNPGGNMTIGVSNGGSVDLIGDNNRGLIINGYKYGVDNNITTIISGFSGSGTASSDKVTFSGLKTANISSVMYPDDNHITLQLLDGTSITLNMIGIKQTGYTLNSDIYDNLTMVVCFLSGTMIKMVKGACAVEDLQVGDTVLTYDPKTKVKVKKENYMDW